MDSHTSPARTVLYGAEIFILAAVISKLLAYLFRLVIARLGPEQYGIFSLALAITGIFVVIAVFGLDTGVLRFLSRYKGQEHAEKGIVFSALKVTSFLSVLLMFVLIFSADYIASLLHAPALAGILGLLAITIPFDGVRSIFISIAKSFKKIEYELYSKELAENIIKVVLAYLFLFLGLNLFGVVLAYILAIAVSCLYLVHLIKRFKADLIYIPEAEPAKSEVKAGNLLSFSWPLVFSALIIFLISWTDSIILGYFKDAYSVGLYNAAIPSAKLLQLFPQAAVVLLMPAITGLILEKKRESSLHIANLLSFITKWNVILMLVPLAVFLIFPSTFLSFFFGKEYALASSALFILGIGFFLSGLYFIPRELLYILGKTKAIFIINFAGFIVNLLLNLALVPRYGLNGSAFATASTFALMSVLVVPYARKVSGISQHSFPFIRIGLSALFAFLPLWYLSKLLPVLLSSPLLALLFAMLAIILFFILLYLFRVFDKQDYRMIKLVMGQIKGIEKRLEDKAKFH
ncbi:flippase [archaeon]|nr:flippase [archaeon]